MRDQNEEAVNLSPFDSKTYYYDFLTRRYFRHRHIAFAIFVCLVLLAIASINNRMSLKLVLTPSTGLLSCYQGILFPFGWEKIGEYAVGLEPGWEKLIADTKLGDQLTHGISLRHPNQIEPYLIRILIQLGKHSVNNPTIDQQREAIYYFQKVEDLGRRSEVAPDLAAAYFNLATLIYEQDRDVEEAERLLKRSRDYAANYPGVDELASRLEQES